MVGVLPIWFLQIKPRTQISRYKRQIHELETEVFYLKYEDEILGRAILAKMTTQEANNQRIFGLIHRTANNH
jgi:hypothetical protein